MTSALLDFADLPAQVPATLRGPWAAVVAVTGIDPATVDLVYERPDQRPGARLGSTDCRKPRRLLVKVRPHLTGDELLGVLLHEAVHVRVHQTHGHRAAYLDGPHGALWRAEVDVVCDRLVLPQPTRYYCWPGRDEEAATAVAVRGATR